MVNVKNLIYIYYKKIVRKILKFLFRINQPYNYKPLYNYYHYAGIKPKKLALLSYRVLQLREQSKKTWSSGGDVHDFIQVLSEVGYKTDIVDSRDKDFVPHKKYDLFIGHEGYNFKKICENLPKKTTKIFFLATSYWKYLNSEEQKRIESVYKRRGVLFKSEREIKAGEDETLKMADGVLMLGNEDCRKTYPNSEKFFILDNASYLDRGMIDLKKKNFLASKDNFLILSGSGNVHKGLDLLLEVFSKLPDKHLYICSQLEEDFAREYKKELFDTENIHYIGYIKLYKKEFFDLMYKCNYLIFPSCSEGSPGSVVDCMVQGLIPIVTKSSHIDVDGLGFYIEPCNHDKILELVNEVSSHDNDWYKERSFEIQKEAIIRFDPKLFKMKLKKFITNTANLSR